MFDMVLNKRQNYLHFFPWFSQGYSGLFDICQTDYSTHPKHRIFPLFSKHTWKYNIQVNKRLTKVKEK